MTPDLLKAVGAIVIQWSLIDHEITRICENWWYRAFPNERVPRSFDRRLDGLKVIGSRLFMLDAAEHRIFRWYLHRLAQADSKRDDISHGIPVKATHPYKKIEYDALRIPFPSRPTRFQKMSVDGLYKFYWELDAMFSETVQVGLVISHLQQASFSHRSIWHMQRGLQPVRGMSVRSPKLPRLKPPPPTWRG